jgi:hypothetical protein
LLLRANPDVQYQTHPFGPTRPYLLPAEIWRVAFTKRSFPRAEMENFSTWKRESWN